MSTLPLCDTDPLNSPWVVSFRLTGSLALSIAYGIQVENMDNEFFRMYKELSAEAGEAMVLGAFLVDIIPPRGFNRLNMSYGKALINSR